MQFGRNLLFKVLQNEDAEDVVALYEATAQDGYYPLRHTNFSSSLGHIGRGRKCFFFYLSGKYWYNIRHAKNRDWGSRVRNVHRIPPLLPQLLSKC